MERAFAAGAGAGAAASGLAGLRPFAPPPSASAQAAPAAAAIHFFSTRLEHHEHDECQNKNEAGGAFQRRVPVEDFEFGQSLITVSILGALTVAPLLDSIAFPCAVRATGS